MSDPSPRILYCRCAFAQVVPEDTKAEVLKRLDESGAGFEAVSDLCEMAARNDERLKELAEGDTPIRIAACYPRAVKWLFHQAGAPLDDGKVEICNMREDTAETVADSLLK